MKKLILSLVTVLVLLVPSVGMTADASAPSSIPVIATSPVDASVPLTTKFDAKFDVGSAATMKGEEKPSNMDGVQIVQAIRDIWTSFKSGNVWNGISIILMLLTFVFGLVRSDIPPKYLPWVAAGLGISTNIVSAILGGTEWGAAVFNGFFQGAAAAGLWSIVGKHILRSKEEREKRARAREIVSGNITSGSVEK